MTKPFQTLPKGRELPTPMHCSGLSLPDIWHLQLAEWLVNNPKRLVEISSLIPACAAPGNPRSKIFISSDHLDDITSHLLHSLPNT